MMLASHLVMHGYGHWLSNDPRGSGSTETRKPELRDLGPVHFGRKPNHGQPSRQELKGFYRQAEPRLEFDPLWFRRREHDLTSRALRDAVRRLGYTVYACALCANHMHVIVRAHRDRAVQIWENLARATGDSIRAADVVPPAHPVWSARPYKVFLFAWQDVVDRVAYVEDNPGKEGLARQTYDFVSPLPNRCAGMVPTRRRPRDPRGW
jgi:REP element-mobilizing transposase RayT